MQKAIYLVALLIGLGGCASSGPLIERPTVQLSGVEITRLSFSEQTVQLTLDVANPNAFPLPVRTVRYSVLLEQQQFAAGETAASFSVPARGETAVDISVTLNLMESAARLLPMLRAGTSRPLDYELHGSLAVDIPFARPLQFSREGTIVVR